MHKKRKEGKTMGEVDRNLDEVITRTRGAPADYTIDVYKAMNDFFREFSEEIEYQSTKVNKASERRMRVLLRSFYERVYTPYRDATRQVDKDSGTSNGEESD
jgi:hypothetical protein